jgi:peptidyl-prolyl cis-trans isomerase C
MEMSNKIKCAHILVEKQSQALELLEKIKKGGKFGAIAKETSTCPSAKKEGNLGYFTKGMMVKPFEEVAFKLQIGEISEPVKTEFGYHIIKRLG